MERPKTITFDAFFFVWATFGIILCMKGLISWWVLALVVLSKIKVTQTFERY